MYDAVALQTHFRQVGHVELEIDGLERELFQLRRYLQAALKLEHATIPPYLTALYSMKSEMPWQVVEIFRSVVVEEMLHMVLVANVLNAIGGHPVTDTPEFLPNYPSPLPYGIGDITVSLYGFSHQAVDQGLAIERPDTIDFNKLALMAANTPDLEHVPPHLTIGEFYAFIGGKLHGLVKEYGPEKVFIGNPDKQIASDTFYYEGAGNVLPIYGPQDAERAFMALDVIRDQGEGANDDIWNGNVEVFHSFPEVAHYFRFNQVQEGRMYVPGDTVNSGPTGPELVVPWDAAYKIATNPKISQYPVGSEVRRHADAFNRAYCDLLRDLHHAFNGQPNRLLQAVPRMFILKEAAQQLMRNPFPGREHEGVNAAPTYEYVPTA